MPLKSDYITGQQLDADEWNVIAQIIIPDATYSIDGVNYASKLTVKGTTKDTEDGSKMALSAVDSDGRPVMNVDNAGRQNLFCHNSNGSVSVLYNLFNPNSTQNMIAGHFAFGAKNAAGNLNTIATFLAETISRTTNAMSSRIALSYMDAANTSGGYTQPNKIISISKDGFILPSIQMYGITNLASNSLTVDETISCKNMAIAAGLSAGNVISSNGASLFGAIGINKFGARQYINLDVNGVLGVNNEAADTDGVGLYIFANEHVAAKATSIQGANSALSVFKNILINALGGKVGIGIITEPTDKLEVGGNVKANDATQDGHLVTKRQLDGKKAAVNADAVSADATDLPTAITLINELKVTVNALQSKMRAAGLLTT